jgi:hypothetical protein
MWDRDTKTLAGFCGGILLLIALAVLLFDVVGKGEPKLWAEIGTAVGTLALAVATFWSITRTNAVIEGEERRHQQQFAPLVRLEFSLIGATTGFPASEGPFQGFEAVNIGNGLAVNVIIDIDAVLNYETSREIMREVPGTFPVGTGQYVGDAATASIRRTLFASAIEKDGRARFGEPIFRDVTYGRPHMQFLQVRLLYQDMFGNEYATVYEPGRELDVYEWFQPPSLRRQAV